MAPARVQHSKRETSVGVLILCVLLLISAGLYWKQSRYDPAIFAPAAPESSAALSASPGQPEGALQSDLQAFLPAGLSPMSPMETFGPENLSDKIDGKAELYLSAGFVSLRSQRFVDADNPDSWIEVFVYDMGEGDNAFAVFSSQRRPDAEQIDLTRFAYRTQNALYFAHGSEYVEMVASIPSETASAGMLAFGESFVGAKPLALETTKGPVSGIALFPKEHLDEGSITLLPSDAFGFDRLDRIMIAGYTLDGGSPITAFFSERETPQEATELADSYHAFLVENGGSGVESALEIPGARVVAIFDLYEIIFTHGNLLAGVHEAENRASAEELAVMLYRKLTEDKR